MHHDLKIHPQHGDSKQDGVKDWEIRRNDRDFQTNDTVTFHDFIEDDGYTERKIGPVQIIGPVIINAAGLQPGYCIFQHTRA